MSEMGSAMMGTGRSSGPNRARDAAEAAIRSPLLDDIDINGARGILVNVAGADLTMGEFMEVGDMVEEFASENATVVVGTVIDESLGDDMMVTIVATGLGKASKPSIVIDNDPAIETAGLHGNYDDFDTPPHARNPVRYPNSVENVDIQSKDLDYLDVPAFLRRQAD
jgi:cell division protein FtsZ